jgi:Zn-dependent peptidase ImmA (M78 family)
VMHDIPVRAEDAEREADEFASEFLMPAAEIRHELQHMDLARAAQLKTRWKTSMASLIRRARDLHQIDDAKYRSLNVQISQRGWRKSEPVDLPHDQLNLLDQVIQVHHDAHGYTVAELAFLTGLFKPEYAVAFNDGGAGHLRAL